jgi:hypothetical protein
VAAALAGVGARAGRGHHPSTVMLGLFDSFASGSTRAGHLGIGQQRLSVILQRVPAAELEAALAAGAGKVRCPHRGLWVAPHEAGRPQR